MPKPTLILAPGAWYPSSAFDPLIAQLAPHGYTCQTVSFPSIQQATEVQDLSADINAVRALVEAAVNASQEVIIVSHSWSGLPVNSALKGLSRVERQKEGREGGVTKLIFISAFLPDIGESLIGAFGGVPPEWYVMNVENATVTADDPYTLFFHDVPDGREWAKTLRPHAWATKNSPATGTAYVHIPAAYLLCEKDRAIPLFVQELMVEKARQKGASVETEKIQTAHTPWLVDPDRVATYIRMHAGEQV
ncbi:Alpha/beta hydrolase fold-1 [Aspergillus bertholletiae]|uniref:Alpha/beta hydrolase fold-1 n=1 Tax=Aspergillus bertholletiae TaxID=1226010 RepID=A0A5N7BEW6_9EURO|nr:Alpha/beta hydrolase fold-1 [Aspergillus bertholletiae]